MSDTSPPAPAGAELVELPERGRIYRQERRPLLGDCAPSGRIRLDAIARWLQDVAFLDVDDAGVAHLAVWVVRRSRVCVLRFPRFGEHLRLETFCSGMGKMWAERRTRISTAAEGQPLVEAVALWVHLDPATRRPSSFTEEETLIYGDAAGGRRVTARLRHPAPPQLAATSSWQFRNTDLDVAGHVNNAAYWLPVEEELLGAEEPEQLDVEIEFRGPAQPGEMAVLERDGVRWILSRDGETHASIVLNPVPS